MEGEPKRPSMMHCGAEANEANPRYRIRMVTDEGGGLGKLRVQLGGGTYRGVCAHGALWDTYLVGLQP